MIDIGDSLSSPSKQATTAATNANNLSMGDIQQLESYVSGQQGQLRSAISGMGPNPYFGASSQVNPSMYAVNPDDTTTFGSQGNGTYSVTPSRTAPVSQTAPTSGSNPSPKTPTNPSTPTTPTNPVSGNPVTGNPVTRQPGPGGTGPNPASPYGPSGAGPTSWVGSGSAPGTNPLGGKLQ